jgi:hypothetical protein
MMNKAALKRGITILSAAASSLLLTLAVSPAASANTTRTLNLSIVCATGEAYGLQIDTGSGFYQPSSGSSYVVGDVKYFTVPISASATTLQVMPLSCDNQPTGYPGPDPAWEPHSITPGTSTISASTYCQDYNYSYGYGQGALIFDCPITNLTYS